MACRGNSITACRYRGEDRPINIVIVVNSLEKGGRTKHIVEEYLGLQKRGHSVSLVSFSAPPRWVIRHYRGSASWIIFKKNKSKLDIFLLLKLFNFIRSSRASVVHSHCETSSFYAGLVCQLRGVPIVGTIHRSELRYYAPTWRNRLFYRFLDSYIAVSHERKRRLVSHLWLASEKISVLHWGINAGAIPADYDILEVRKKLQLPEGRMLFSLGHLGPIKGHDDSIKAIPRIRSRFPDVRLYIAGDGLAEDHERLHSLIEERHLQGVVILLGQITNSLEWMQACDIFLQPSREEAFGLVFLEAGLCSKPTVSTLVGGVPEIIVDGETGHLVSTLNPDGLAEKVIELLASEEDIATMGAAAKQYIEKNFVLSEKILKLESYLLGMANRADSGIANNE